MQEAAQASEKQGGAAITRKPADAGKGEPVVVRKEGGGQIYVGYDKECAPREGLCRA